MSANAHDSSLSVAPALAPVKADAPAAGPARGAAVRRARQLSAIGYLLLTLGFLAACLVPRFHHPAAHRGMMFAGFLFLLAGAGLAVWGMVRKTMGEL